MLPSEAQSVTSPQVHPSVAKVQDSGDKPIYVQLIERVAAFAKQLLDKVPTGITSAFTGPDWMRNVALVLISFAVLPAIYLKLKERFLAQNQLSNIERSRNLTSKRPAGSGGIRAGKPQSQPRNVPGGAARDVSERCTASRRYQGNAGRTTEGESLLGNYKHIYRGKYIYWVVSKGAPQFEWERIVLDSIPKQPMMIDALIDRLHNALVGLPGHSSAGSWGNICDTEGFSTIPCAGDVRRGQRVACSFSGSYFGLHRVWSAVLLAVVLLGVLAQWANLASSVVGGIVLGVIYAVVVEPSRIGHITPTRAGLQEISRWLALKESPLQFDPLSDADRSDSLLPYAIAFDEAERWLQDNNPAPSWFDAMNLRTYASGVNYDKMPPKPLVPFAFQRSNDAQNLIPDNDESYHAFMSARGWGLSGRSSRAAEAAVREQEQSQIQPARSSGGGGGSDGGGDGGGA